jgi:hypothetical protein
MKARLLRLRGRRCLVWLDSKGQALPVADTRRAWRTLVYRPPVMEEA